VAFTVMLECGVPIIALAAIGRNRLLCLKGSPYAAGGSTTSHCWASLGNHRMSRAARSYSVTFRSRQAGSRKNPITRASSMAARSCGFL
jgi:hypothetical protein